MRICLVVPIGECLRVKADKVLFAGNTVWSISERVNGFCEDALYKSTLPSLPLPLPLPLPLHLPLQECSMILFNHTGKSKKGKFK